MKRLFLTAGVAACLAGPALADPVVIDFDALGNNVKVNDFYAGGTDSVGLAGFDLGVRFVDFVTASGSFTASAPRYAYAATARAVIDVAAGFSSFDFAYGTLAPATVNVYEGLDGTGALLGSLTVSGHADAFASASVPFLGLGHSVTLVSLPNYAAVDNLAFGYPPPVPEPAGWALLLGGLGVSAAYGRRRR